MNEITRGQFRFVKIGEVVHVWMGPVGDPESERVMTIHESFLKDIVAGLTAHIQHKIPNNKKKNK